MHTSNRHVRHDRVPSKRTERLAWTAALILCAPVRARSRGAPAAARRPPRARHAPQITTPPSNELASLAISPDGEKLVFVAVSEGRPRLWLRSLITGEARALSGTDGSMFPFWSPDSHSIGFFADGRLYSIDVDGGALSAVARVPVPAGGTWSREGVILFTIVPDGPILRVSAMGGAADAVPGSDALQGGNRFPQFLPDSRHYLYFVAEPAIRGVASPHLTAPSGDA